MRGINNANVDIHVYNRGASICRSKGEDIAMSKIYSLSRYKDEDIFLTNNEAISLANKLNERVSQNFAKEVARECPCCGEGDTELKHVNYNLPEWYVICKNCKLRSGSAPTVLMAIKLWNTRKTKQTDRKKT